MESTKFLDLSDRVKLRVSGADAGRFLNGQITNDVRKATESEALEACVLNARGKLNAHLFVTKAGDDFLIDAAAELVEHLPARLERYVIADDVRIADVTTEFALFHLLAPAPALQLSTVRALRYSNDGRDVWVPAEQRAEVREIFLKQFDLCNSECAELMRIESGLPRWGRELTEEIIPIEANLEERCVDYDKGCYIGQEVISRMKMSGQTNKRLCGLVSSEGIPLHMDAELSVAGVEKPVGWITSATRSPRLNREIALGYVKRGFNDAGTLLRAGSAGSTTPGTQVQVVALPFI